jgi:L-ascorbate metabolism protein UlaG (beta-lactamase superfamily)
MARRTPLPAVAPLLALALSCGYPAHLVAGNAAAFLQAPAEVPHRITHPYRPDARLAVLWVGHATALLQLGDRFVLTDPLFTGTAGMLSRRLVEPGLDPRDLPALSAVLISHTHFDHLSFGSLEMIEEKTRVAFAPAGALVYIPNFAFDTVPLAPFERWEYAGLRVTAVPVRHQGGRYGIDRAWMTDSFTGFVVEHGGLTVYFGGDTAYDRRSFAETRARFPSIDLALLPIAPIEPRAYNRPRHTDPDEALQAFADLGARWMVPIHYDTFVNSLDEPGDALRALRRAMQARGLGPDRVIVLAPGEQRVLVPRRVLNASR